jgi:hypothetical protein
MVDTKGITHKLVTYVAADGETFYVETPISKDEPVKNEPVRNIPIPMARVEANSNVEVLDLPKMTFNEGEGQQTEPDPLDANGIQTMALPEMRFEKPKPKAKPKPANGEVEVLDLPTLKFTDDDNEK